MAYLTGFEFLTAISFAFIATLLARRMKVAPVPVLLLIAALIGPFGLDLLENKEIESFSSIGAVLLLYIIGLEMKTENIIKIGKKTFVMSLIKMAFSTFVIAEIVLFFIEGIGYLEAFIIGVSFSISSTAIFNRAAKDFKFNKTGEAELLYGLLIWEDIFAVLIISLGVVFLTTGSISISIVYSMAMFLLPMIFIYCLAEHVKNYLPKDEEIYFLFYIALATLMIVSAGFFMVPASIAAFTAGVFSSRHKELQIVKEKIDFMTSIFITIFFLSLGMNVNISALLNNETLIMIGLFLAITVIAKAFFSSLSLGIFGSPAKKAALGGLLMVSTGEFSLLIANELSHIFTIDVISITAGVIFASSIIAWIVPAFSGRYAKILQRVFERGEKIYRKNRAMANYLKQMLIK